MGKPYESSPRSVRVVPGLHSETSVPKNGCTSGKSTIVESWSSPLSVEATTMSRPARSPVWSSGASVTRNCKPTLELSLAASVGVSRPAASTVTEAKTVPTREPLMRVLLSADPEPSTPGGIGHVSGRYLPTEGRGEDLDRASPDNPRRSWYRIRTRVEPPTSPPQSFQPASRIVDKACRRPKLTVPVRQGPLRLASASRFRLGADQRLRRRRPTMDVE